MRIARPEYLALEEMTRAADAEAISEGPFVGIVSDTAFDRLFPGNDEGLASVNDEVEIVTGGTLSRSARLDAAQSLAVREVYEKGRNRESIWTDLFRPLAMRSKRIVLFDRYAFAELHRRNAANNSLPEHLEWLLTKLDASAQQGALVKIFGSTGYGSGGSQVPADPNITAELLSRRWRSRSGRLSGVELVTLPSISAFPHDRHAMFGDTTGLELPSGLDRLAKPFTNNLFSYAYKWRNEQMQALRNRLTQVESSRPQVTAL